MASYTAVKNPSPEFHRTQNSKVTHCAFFSVVTRRRAQKLQNSAPEPTTEGNKPTSFLMLHPVVWLFDKSV